MANDVRHTQRNLPVLIHMGDEQIMAVADIFITPDKVMIQIVSNKDRNNLLGEFLEQAEPIGLSFGSIPVQNKTEKRETT